MHPIVLAALDAERVHQEEQGYTPAHDAGHGPHEWTIILVDLMGEVARAVWQREEESYRQYCDRFDVALRRVAAVAIAAMEVHQQLWREETEYSIPRDSLASAMNNQTATRLARELRRALGCLEYIQGLEPEQPISGGAVRHDVIASASKLLEELGG